MNTTTLVRPAPVTALRVGGTYQTVTGETVKIIDFDIQRDRGFYYVGDNDQIYRMNGGHANLAESLLSVVNLDDVAYVAPEVGARYRTERHDTVRIYRTDDQVEGFPYRSDVGDFYNEKGERYLATPGSNLVALIN